MAGEILLGYDGSEGAQAALPQAVALAQAFRVPLVIAFAYGANPVGGVGGDLARETAKIGERFLAEAADAAKEIDAGVSVETALVDATPVDALASTADARAARVLVVGGNGRSPVVSALLGSVSHKLLGQTSVPVLVVPPRS